MPGSQSSSLPRRSMSLTSSSSLGRRKAINAVASASLGPSGLGDASPSRKSLTTPRSMGLKGDRTVKGLRLFRALTVPDSTSIREACSRMASRKVDAVLLTDSNALLCGIMTAKDITTRVIAREINLDKTPVSKVMTKNPVFVLSDTLAVEALQKMVHGEFRHLPVVEKGEVIALLDIAKCLYDVIARMERAAEKGKAIAAAVEGVEKQWGTPISSSNKFIDILQEQILKPSLSTIIAENSKIFTVDPSDTVLVAAKKILEHHASCAVVTVDNKPRGILTSKDLLMRVAAEGLPPESTPVEKVMTPNPECARIDSPIVDALQTMHNGKFLHLPVVDRDGMIVTVVDVLHITNAVVSNIDFTAEVSNETASTMMQSFWDSAMALGPDYGDETMSENSLRMRSEVGEIQSLAQPSSTVSNSFTFKIEDSSGRLHRFICDAQSLSDLVTAILQKLGCEIDYTNLPLILYEDEDNDKVVLASDSDLQAAMHHARLAGWKGLRLHLDYTGGCRSRQRSLKHGGTEIRSTSASTYSAVAAGATLVAALGVFAFMRRTAS